MAVEPALHFALAFAVDYERSSSLALGNDFSPGIDEPVEQPFSGALIELGYPDILFGFVNLVILFHLDNVSKRFSLFLMWTVKITPISRGKI